MCITVRYSQGHELRAFHEYLNTIYTRKRIFCVLRYSKDRTLCVLHEYCLHQEACSVLCVLHEYCLHHGVSIVV
jgi:hypothetical protein